MKIHKKYSPLWYKKYRYAIVSGGRGSGKSYAVQTFLRDLTYESGHKIAVTRYTMRSAEKSVIPEFTSKMEVDASPYSSGTMLEDFEKNGATVTNIHSKSDLFFMGLKTSSGIQTGALKSIEGLTTWMMEEAEELQDDGTDEQEGTFDKLDNSIRAKGKDLRTILVWNPSTIDSFVYKRFFESRNLDITFNGVYDDTLYIYTTYLNNIENLNSSFIKKANEIKSTNFKRYEHIYLGKPTKQNELALWKMDTMISPYRVTSCPDLKRIVVAVDPSTTSNQSSDEAGVVTVGEGFDGHFYVIDDSSLIASPLEWAKVTIAKYNDFQADTIIAETNQGGDMVVTTIQGVLPHAPVKTIHAKKGKLLRAEPVASLYESGKVHHVGRFQELESEMTSYTGDPKQASPNRLDALVYGLTELAFGDSEPLFFA